MQDSTLLAQPLVLWRRWSLRFSPIRPTALTWRQAISISFLTSRGISRGLISPQTMKWSKLWCHVSNKELLNSSLTACINLFYIGKNVLNDKATMSKNNFQFVAKILYFTSYFHLFKYMVSFSRYSTVCITYQPPLCVCVYIYKNLKLYLTDICYTWIIVRLQSFYTVHRKLHSDIDMLSMWHMWERNETHTQFWLKRLKENVCFEDKQRLGVLKAIRWEVVLGFVWQYTDQWQAVVNMLMNLSVS